jgi:hypothetical protein
MQKKLRLKQICALCIKFQMLKNNVYNVLCHKVMHMSVPTVTYANKYKHFFSHF